MDKQHHAQTIDDKYDNAVHEHHHEADAHEAGHAGNVTAHHLEKPVDAHTMHERHDERAAGGHADHVDHGGHEDLFRRRFWVSLLLSIPVLLYTPMLQMWFGFMMPEFMGSQWIAPLFSVIVFLYGGVPFIQMAIPEIRNRKPGMMLLVSLAISVSFVYSLAAIFANLGEGFFWELVTLIDIMLLGHWLEMRSVRQASGALCELAKLMPDTAERIHHGEMTETVPVNALKHSDIVLVPPDTSIPADEEVADGHSNVNEAMITGESHPVHKMAGAKVI